MNRGRRDLVSWLLGWIPICCQELSSLSCSLSCRTLSWRGSREAWGVRVQGNEPPSTSPLRSTRFSHPLSPLAFSTLSKGLWGSFPFAPVLPEPIFRLAARSQCLVNGNAFLLSGKAFPTLIIKLPSPISTQKRPCSVLVALHPQ